ncbi:DUF5107 domain-containing protein [Brachybacterium phenoliresistens]
MWGERIVLLAAVAPAYGRGMLTAESLLPLAARPAELADRAAAVWSVPTTIPTYRPLPPERFPAYLDRRVYQGSSGAVYPLPFHHQIAAEPEDQVWQAVHLQNAWLHVVVLPELGGRIHIARDRVSGEDLFYANPVIKPALVGLAGPWIAGGVELNWPQHHRPATFLPSDWSIEEEADGSVVVWCGDHDPFDRLQGLHGVRLRPDSSALELAVRLFNRTELEQTFLWWANAAARVHDDCQVFFPHDVRYVADHAKRAVTAFPAADRPYYGVDYPALADTEFTAADGTPGTGDRLDWYRSVPVPTSYMALHSDEDFFGGYDHASGVGFVHVADRRLAVGKKNWTWGNSLFGHAWEQNLSEDGAHYIELMAGVFTDNQPDFAQLAPGETKTFTQRWYPVRGTGAIDRAGEDAAVSLRLGGGRAVARIAAARIVPGARISLCQGGVVLAEQTGDLDPGRTLELRADTAADGPVSVEVADAEGRVLVAWSTAELAAGTDRPEPQAAQEPPAPGEVATAEELALIAEHLVVYRHATRAPEPYWEEALRRDPGHVASLVGLADRAYRRGELETARDLLSRAVARLTRWHPTAQDMRPQYLLGLVHEALGEEETAYDLHARASWSRAWRGPAGYRMARLDARAGRERMALHRLEDVLAVEGDHLQALALRAVCLRRLGQEQAARSALAAALARNPLDALTRALTGQAPSADVQVCLDTAIDLAGFGEGEAALAVLDEATEADRSRPLGQTAGGPLIDYHRAAIQEELGRPEDAAQSRARALSADPTWAYPSRRADVAALRAAGDHDPQAAALQGHWLYAAGRPAEAAAAWERSLALGGDDPAVHRNLGLDAVNRLQDPEAAAGHYAAAVRAAPQEARLQLEIDQLDALRGHGTAQRLAHLREHAPLLAARDDAQVALAHLLVSAGEAAEAAAVLTQRRLQPWEGGEGEALAAWERACIRLAVGAVADKDPDSALAQLQAALAPPAQLGEARHPLASTAQLELLIGDVHARRGQPEAASQAWRRAAEQKGDFLGMQTQEHSETTAWSVLALRRLGRDAEATALRQDLEGFVDGLAGTPPSVDYFATSLPDLLLFVEDPTLVRDRRVAVLRAQLQALDGELDAAADALAAPELASSRHAADLGMLLGDGAEGLAFRAGLP